jgi:hypothetical protein
VEVEGRDKEISFYVTPFNNENVEDFLAQTWDQYKKSTSSKLPSALREDGPTHFRLSPLVLSVTAMTSWLKVLEENCVNAADEAEGTNDTSYPNFTNCVSLFLEEIAGIKYIGDALIRWLCPAKKPMAMTPEVCFRRRATILAYLDGRLLCSKLSRPSAYELAEAVFLAYPRSYQEKYVKTHDELDEEVTPLRSAFISITLLTCATALSPSFKKTRLASSVLPNDPTIIRARRDVAPTSISPAEAVEATVAMVMAMIVATIDTIVTVIITIVPAPTTAAIVDAEATIVPPIPAS